MMRGDAAIKGPLRHPRGDAALLSLALVQGAALMLHPSFWLITLGLWWNANTISHNFIHSPFFRAGRWNAIFSAYLSLLLGLPQTLWRARHLAHHAGVPGRKLEWRGQLAIEVALVVGLWAAMLLKAPHFFLNAYLPALGLGLCLCQLQGHYEHLRGPVSHYGWLYNVLFFNDGYHVEHHLRPAEHWSRLPKQKAAGASVSRWPAVLRWLELLSLDSMERLVLHSKFLQSFVLKKHEEAFRAILAQLPELRSVGIIGGGMFPRTALILRRLSPGAKLTVLEARAESIQQARRFLNGEVEFTHQFYDPAHSNSMGEGVDLLIIPLAFEGNRAAIYERPPARHVVVHDWLWRRRGDGVIISWPLLKRLNLVAQ